MRRAPWQVPDNVLPRAKSWQKGKNEIKMKCCFGLLVSCNIYIFLYLISFEMSKVRKLILDSVECLARKLKKKLINFLLPQVSIQLIGL